MFKLSTFLDAARAAATCANPVERLQALLGDAVSQSESVRSALPPSNDPEVVLLDSPELTVYHIQLPPGVHYPPHSHGVSALIGMYRGSELNVLYRRQGASISEVERRICSTPDVLVLEPDEIHSVANAGTHRSGAIHLYLGDLLRRPRSLWRPDGTEEQAFDDSLYFALAQPFEPDLG